MKHVSWVIALVIGLVIGFFGRGAIDVNTRGRSGAPSAAAPAPRPAAPQGQPREDPKAVYRVPLDDSPTKGPADALVTVVESSDFQCPFCKRFAPTMKQLESAYAGKVRFAFKHNALSMHPMAAPAANATEEARAQGGDSKFWALHDKLFELPELNVDAIVKAATDVGVDGAKVRAAIEQKKYAARLDRDQALVNGLGAGATPTIFVNGRKIEGAYPFETFKAVIDEELAKAEAMVKAGTSPRDVYQRIMSTAATQKVMLPGAAAVENAPGAPAAPAAPPPSQFAKVTVRADDPAKGPKDAKVTVVLFSDFQCPFCSRVEPGLKQLEEALRGQVRVVWKHQPLSMHPNAMPAAMAAEAAREQGKFWQLHEKLFANQTALDGPSLERWAKEAGLDLGRYRAFVQANRAQARIAEDQALGGQVGAGATPTMFFNCRKVVGAKPFEQLKAIADEELAKVDALLAGKRPDAGTYDRACDANVTQGATLAAAGGGITVRPDDPVKGNKAAPVSVVIFSDFQCPFCSRLLPALEQVEKTYGNRVKLVWKHLPLPPSMHPQAQAAAEAAEAAREQGKFWQMHDVLFANQRDFQQPDAFTSLARKAGLDLGRFQASLASGNGRKRVLEDQAMAGRAGIEATPTMMVNGEKVEGAVPFETLKAVIDRKLSAAR